MADLYIVYGKQGVGKTSLVALCNNPILIDCENSIDRALEYAKYDLEFNGKYIPIRNHKDFESVLATLPTLTKGGDTIFIDTIGGMQSMIISELTKAKAGIMQIQMYAQLSAKCSNFIKGCLATNCKRVVVLCHENTKEILNEERSFAIQGEGGNFTEKLPSLAFGVARLRMEKSGTFLDFRDEQGLSCKCPDALKENPCIPIRTPLTKELLNNGDALPMILEEEVFKVVENSRQSFSAKRKEYADKIKSIKEDIDKKQSLSEIEAIENFLPEYKLPIFIYKVVKKYIDEKKLSF